MAFVPDEAIARSHEISPSAFRLYCYYCQRRNEQGVCWPSLRLVASDLHMAYSYASEMRSQLASKGWVELGLGGQIKPLVGFGYSETVSEKPKNVSEFPKTRPVENSEFPKGISEKPKQDFGISETHVRKNQPNEPQQQQRAHAREGVGEGGKARASLAAAVLEACALPSDAGESVIREACRVAEVIAANGGTVESLRRFADTRRKIPKLRYFAQDWLEWRAERPDRGRPAARASPALGCPKCRGDTPGFVLAPDRSRMVRCACNPPKPKQAEAVTA